LLKTEKALNVYTGPDSGTQALLWLTRNLLVMCHFINRLLSKDSETRRDTANSFVHAYTKHLAKCHNWMVQRLF